MRVPAARLRPRSAYHWPLTESESVGLLTASVVLLALPPQIAFGLNPNVSPIIVSNRVVRPPRFLVATVTYSVGVRFRCHPRSSDSCRPVFFFVVDCFVCRLMVIIFENGRQWLAAIFFYRLHLFQCR